MHDMQTMAVLVMCALEFEYQLALGLGNSDSSTTCAQGVVRTKLPIKEAQWIQLRL
jgi:hypothetical protein